MKENHSLLLRHQSHTGLILSLVVCLAGCGTPDTERKKLALDEAPVLQPGPMAWIPIISQIDLRPPAKTPPIQIAGGLVALKVSESPTLRTLGHIADGSINYLMAPVDARKLADKHGEHRYLFSHARNATIISGGAPGDWIEQAILKQLLQSGVRVQPSATAPDTRAMHVVVKGLSIAVARRAPNCWWTPE